MMMLVTATVHTAHYEFVGVGLTQIQATESLLLGWAAHVESVPEADPELMREFVDGGDVDFGELSPAQCYRDGSPLLGCAS